MSKGMSNSEDVKGGDDAKKPPPHTVTVIVDDHKHHPSLVATIDDARAQVQMDS